MLKIVGIGEGQTCKVGPVGSHVFVILLFFLKGLPNLCNRTSSWLCYFVITFVCLCPRTLNYY